MARCVVVRRGVARDLRAAQLVDVAVAVDADVIGDVDASLLFLVVVLVLPEALWGIAVVAEDHGLVVEGHTGDGLSPTARARGSGAPSVSAQHDSRGRAERDDGLGRGREWRDCRTRTRASRG